MKKASRTFGGSKLTLGYSLIELLISLGVFTIFLMGSVESFWRAEQALQAQTETMTRARVIQNLINILGMPSGLRVTAYKEGLNSDLGKCIFGKSASCPNPNQLRDLILLLPPLTATSNHLALSGPMTGGPAAPMLYNMAGVACNPATSASCTSKFYPIAVSTQWEAICPPKCDVTYTSPAGPWVASDGTNHVNPEGLQIPNACQRAHYIKIHYKFELASGAPTKYNFKAVTGSIMVSATMAAAAY
jgi:hypothetical protein